MGSGTTDRVVLGLLVLAAVLLCSKLDNGYLWQDEAETALLARNTLTFGYPRAFDGRNWIDEPLGYGPHEAWIYSPWLPFYLLGGVFAIAGESTWTARFPFVLFGLLSIYLTWRLACRLTEDRSIQRLSVALLTCSVPFLLHMRQCRYYAMITAWVLAMCLAYLAFLREPSLRRALVVGLILVVLFYTNFATCVPVLIALVLHQGGWGTRETRRRFIGMMGLVVAGTLPWAVWCYRPAFVGSMSLSRLWKHLEYYVRITNKHLVPLAFMVTMSGLGALMPRRRSSPVTGPSLSPVIRWFLSLVVLTQVAFLLVVPDQRHMRYLIPTLPLLLIGEAWWLAAQRRWNRFIGSAIVALVLFTNVLQSVPVRVPLALFIDELTHRYTGPMEGIVAYLRAYAQPTEVAKIPYDDRTLMFYTHLTVERPSKFSHETYPDWVIIRRDWVPSGFFETAYFHRIEMAYERIELEAPDILWQNREDPGSHHFRTVEDAPRVVIFRKRKTQRG